MRNNIMSKVWMIGFIIILSITAGCKKENRKKALFNIKDKYTVTKEEIHPVIQKLVDSEEVIEYFPEADHKPHLVNALKRFYQKRGYQLAWNEPMGKPLPQTKDLIETLKNAGQDGLNPKHYNIDTIVALYDSVKNIKIKDRELDYMIHLIDLDLWLTSSYLNYAAHLMSGRMDPEEVDPQWFTYLNRINTSDVLETALEENNIKQSLASLAPPHEGYKRLKNLMVYYDNLVKKGGWPKIPEGDQMDNHLFLKVAID